MVSSRTKPMISPDFSPMNSSRTPITISTDSSRFTAKELIA